MIKQLLQETYSNENQRLLQYLLQKPFDLSNCWEELADCWSGFESAAEQAGTSYDELYQLQLNDEQEKAWELCYKIDAWLDKNPDVKEQAGEAMASGMPTQAPTWAFLTLNRKSLLPPATWLVHWTNDAVSISREGFTHGVHDITVLGLTTYRSKASKAFGGYNFAFLATDSDAENDDRKYGSECVIFQSSGVECYHAGDEEDQIIFWGSSITTKPIAIVEGDEGKMVVLKADGSPAVAFDDVSDCFRWVIQNGRQYSKVL